MPARMSFRRPPQTKLGQILSDKLGRIAALTVHANPRWLEMITWVHCVRVSDSVYQNAHRKSVLDDSA